MAELKLALLGSPHVTVDGQSIVVESRKALALLCYLVITRQRQSRDLLATLFWPEQDQSRARASLRQALWLLRNAGLEPWLVVEQDALELQGVYWCDVHHFQRELSAGEVSAEQIDAALALYNGDLLSGFSLRDCPEFDQWHFLQADALRRQLANALEACVLRCVASGEYGRGLEYARRWLALDALHEPVHRHLMQLYAYAGQHAAALRQYEECARLLADELGVDPEEATTELYQAIKSRQISPLVKTSPEIQPAGQPAPNSASSVDVPPAPRPLAPAPPLHNLPTQLTPFVGREAEIDELAKMVAAPECRLISVVGPGGIGKTRLAMEVARIFVSAHAGQDAATASQSPLFPHGVLFVALNAVESANGIVAAIAEAGSFVFYNSEATRQQLVEYLRERKMLLLLDNFEHLLEHADLIVDILTHAPHITLLVTSREALNLQGEWLWHVNGLRFPDEEIAADRLGEWSAVQMFVQSARRIQSDFALAAEISHIVRICRLVGGMPLAIELAVAWLRVIPCAQIAREIERDLDFLTTRLRDVPDRHRSIHAVFEHSWRLLSPSEQATFPQLSIFRGGFDRQAAEQVAGASWRDLATLVEKSLLSLNANGRYAVHELLRQYGAGKLDGDPAEKQATQERFCSYFSGFMAARERALNGPGQLQAAADMAGELDNIRAACQWAVQQRRLDDITRSATSFYFFCQLQSRFLEGARTLEEFQMALETLEASSQRDLTLAHVHCHQGWLYLRLGEFEKAATVLQRSRDFYAQVGEPPQGYMGGDPTVPLAIVRQIQGDFEAALALAQDALVMAERQQDPHNLAFTHYALTTTNLALGNYDVAQIHVKAASAAARAAGTRWFPPYVLNESGKVARAMRNYAEAQKLFQESYEIKQEFNDPEGMAVALNHLGEIAFLSGDYATARQRYADAMSMYSDINDRGGLAVSSRGLGQIASVEQDYKGAKAWFEHSLKIAMEIRFWPLIYTLLLDISHLLMQTCAEEIAIEALVLALNQRASDYETKERARHLLVQWQDTPNAEQFAKAVQRGAEGDVESLLQRILAELAVT